MTGKKGSAKWICINFIKKYGLFVILAIFIVVFSTLNTQFLTPGNLLNILRQISMFGIVVVGYTMVMISGGCDMSVGGQLALCGMFAATLNVTYGLPTFVVVILTLMLGALFGLINGLLMNVFNIMPLIVTLGTMLFFQGASYIISGGVAIFGLSDSFKLSVRAIWVLCLCPSSSCWSSVCWVTSCCTRPISAVRSTPWAATRRLLVWRV